MFPTTIVIPAYNEAERLPNTLEALASLCPGDSLAPVEVREVIVVDDGSSDTTSEVAASYSARLPRLRVIKSPRNFGKGHAVRQGLSAASQQWVLIADADMSTPWPEAGKLARACQGNHALLAIGSRDVPGCEIRRHQSFVRENLGKTFNVFVRGLTGLPFKDTQCGFKLVNREAIGVFLDRLEVDRFAWDVEVLMFARQAGLGIVEVPVVWEHKEASRVGIFTDGFGMAGTVAKLRFKMLFAPRSVKLIAK
jgi:glycosyltransferase involved in cell wall biosynthesis